MARRFYGWWITAAAFITFGLAVGIPYYNISFFYDYFQRAFGWSRADITLGFPLAAALTILLLTGLGAIAFAQDIFLERRIHYR